MRTDLHIHTTASDGCWTPEQVVTGVRSEGIELFAVTDHDSVDSVAVTESLSREAGLAFLRGVEVSSVVEGRLFHILGYGIDPTDARLLAMLAENRAKLESTDDHDIRQLIALGYPLDFDDYLAYTYARTRGGFKSLNYLIDQGLCTGVRDFFDNIRAKFSHPWPDFPHSAEVAQRIREAGGAPILAHPGVSLKHAGGITGETLAPFLRYGVAGIECYSQYHSPEMIAFCVAWCDRHGWLVTGGSDYHGGFAGRILGNPIVDSADLRLGELEKQIIR